MKSNIKILTIVFLCTLLLSCKKEQPPSPKFKIEYHYIINGGSGIDLLDGYSSTIFPEEKIQDMVAKGVNEPGSQYTLIVGRDILGYSGVRMYMEIGIRKEWEPGKEYFRRWSLPTKIINNESDRIMKFVYPEDTLNAIRIK